MLDSARYSITERKGGIGCVRDTLPILVHVKHSLTRSPFSSSALTTRPRPRSFPSHAGARHQTPNRNVWTSLMTSVRFRDCSMHSCLHSSCCRVGSHLAMSRIVSIRLRPSFLVLLTSCGDDKKSHIYTVSLVLVLFHLTLRMGGMHHNYVYRILIDRWSCRGPMGH